MGEERGRTVFMVASKVNCVRGSRRRRSRDDDRRRLSSDEVDSCNSRLALGEQSCLYTVVSVDNYRRDISSNPLPRRRFDGVLCLHDVNTRTTRSRVNVG